MIFWVVFFTVFSATKSSLLTISRSIFSVKFWEYLFVGGQKVGVMRFFIMVFHNFEILILIKEEGLIFYATNKIQTLASSFYTNNRKARRLVDFFQKSFQ